MPKIVENKIMNFSAKEIYDLVVDVENYPLFLPWCKNAHITKHISDANFHAELLINFKNIFEKYTSDVVFLQKSASEYFVEARAIKGPFKNLVNQWKISEIDHKKTQVEFFLEFEFNSILLTKMLGAIFSSATQKMMNAFENRALNLYKIHH
jgi:coenzyme Q-binding protein COQ10